MTEHSDVNGGEPLSRTSGDLTCERCGTTLVPIEYGLPDAELWEEAARGEVLIGGCMRWDDEPTHGCPTCHGPML